MSTVTATNRRSDFTEDLEKFDVPTLLLHGEDDQSVPARASSMKSARIIRGSAHRLSGDAPRTLR